MEVHTYAGEAPTGAIQLRRFNEVHKFGKGGGSLNQTNSSNSLSFNIKGAGICDDLILGNSHISKKAISMVPGLNLSAPGIHIQVPGCEPLCNLIQYLKRKWRVPKEIHKKQHIWDLNLAG